MIEVADSLAYLRTRFQTLITSPQVVSTIWQPRSLICCWFDNSVPNAGRRRDRPGIWNRVVDPATDQRPRLPDRRYYLRRRDERLETSPQICQRIGYFN